MSLKRDERTSLTNPVQEFVMGGAIETLPPNVTTQQCDGVIRRRGRCYYIKPRRSSPRHVWWLRHWIWHDTWKCFAPDGHTWSVKFTVELLASEIRYRDKTQRCYLLSSKHTHQYTGLQRHLRESSRQLNFFKKDDGEFITFRQCLNSRMKELTAAGVGV